MRLLNNGADVKGGSKNVEIAFFVIITIIITIHCDVFVPIHVRVCREDIAVKATQYP